MTETKLMREMHAEQAIQQTQIKNIEKDVAAIKDSVVGNGKPGLVVRVDRIEQRDKMRGRLVWTLAGVLFATTANVIASIFWS
jgi:hypothetical protein